MKLNNYTYLSPRSVEVGNDVWLGADVWFVWTDGIIVSSPNRSYTNWNSGGPTAGRFCVIVLGGLWHDSSCTTVPYKYICEMESWY